MAGGSLEFGLASFLGDDLGAGPPLMRLVDQNLPHFGVVLLAVVGVVAVVGLVAVVGVVAVLGLLALAAFPAEPGNGRKVEELYSVVVGLEVPQFVHLLEHLMWLCRVVVSV